MGVRDEEKQLLSEPVVLTDSGKQARVRSFKRSRSFSLPYKKIGLGFGGLAVLAIIGFAGYRFYESRSNKPTANPAVQQKTATSASTENNSLPAGGDVEEAELTENYSGESLRVEFNYPKTWKVSEAESGIRIESQEFTYASKVGEKTGYFRIYLRTGARAIDGKYIGSGIAIKPSEKLTYTAPAVGQRNETLLSSFGKDAQDNFAFFMVAGNFQLNPGDSLGPNYGKEPETYIIAGGYSDAGLKDDMATNPVALDYYATTNAYKQAVEIIKSLKLK